MLDRLIIGAGPKQQKDPNYRDVITDIRPYPNVDKTFDANLPNWPFEDNSFHHINATHVLEHLRAFGSFFDECHRVLKAGGNLYVETPHVANIDLAFSDPTHMKYFTEYSFINYITLAGMIEHPWVCKHAWCPIWVKNDHRVICLLLYPIPDDQLDNPILNEQIQKQ